MKIQLPRQVKYIIDRLNAAGFEAYSVGGCVRDSLIGRIPGDWDITTSALPAEIKKVFRHTVDTGIEHGTVTVLIYPDTLEKEGCPSVEEGEADGTDGCSAAALNAETGRKPADAIPENRARAYEVTTYRIDGAYKDGRHPEQVTFTANLEEDLKRRDFTINAMAYNDASGLVDLFGGREDLKNGIVRCVGDPDARFGEDALRILRAVRFSAQLNFKIDAETAAAVTRHAAHLEAVSKERIFTELNKLLCSGHSEQLQKLFELNLSGYIADGFARVRPLGPGTDTPLDPADPDRTLPEIPLENKGERYALICRGFTEEQVKKLLRALKSDLDTIRLAAYLAPRLLEPVPADRYEFKKKMGQASPEYFYKLLCLKKQISGTEEYRERCPEEDIDRLLGLFAEIREQGEPVYLKDLVLTGDDLRKAGVPAGPGMGKILEDMLDDVRRNPVHNSVLYLFHKHLGS